MGTDETFLFKSLQRSVDSPENNVSPGVPFDFPRYRYAICLFAQPDNGEHYEQLKLAKIVSSRHFFDYIEESLTTNRW